eukprot:scaffold212_cov173-Amphora_coffeaeformis.AAC.14
MSRVDVFLFVKGKGSDAASYRPRRDESQWWNRRDALVRCIAAYLGGPGTNCVKKSLGLIFEEDWARICLELLDGPNVLNFTPTEKNVISLLKRVAEAVPGTPVQDHGIQATMILSTNAAMNDLPSSLDSKRSILEHVQQKCSIEFLREHGLNSSEAAILKKTNKQKLVGLWKTWVKQTSTHNESDLKGSLLPILRDALYAKETTKTVAAVLHESGNNELPVWNKDPNFLPGSRVVLFLGAVRDMQRAENECLASVCQENTIPLVRIRLSRVPEFTSKILSIVAFHCAHGFLWPALQDLLTQNKRKRAREPNCRTYQAPRHLDVVCIVPIKPEEIVTDLEARTRLMWRLVRCCVVTLWRSKIHADASASPLVNRLHLVFKDANHLTIQQDELVSQLAEQHQAAPCEFQILSALQNRIAEVMQSPRNNIDWSKVAKSLVKSIRKGSPAPFRVISTRPSETTNFVQDFYTSDIDEDTSSGSYILLQTLEPSSDVSKSFEDVFLSSFSKKEPNVMVAKGCFADACVDAPAASITMMQHVAYQGRLVSTFEKSLAHSDRKGKRKS